MDGVVKRLLRDEAGATAIEYGMIAALVSITIIAVLTAMGDSLNNIFGVVTNGMEIAADAASDS